MAAISYSSSTPTWLPYEPSKDCSQGMCSIYCPQWCYFLYPPPPPPSFIITGSGDSPGPAFSPLVVAIIGVLATAFLLVSYYTLISKYCGSFSSFHARLFGGAGAGAGRRSRGSDVRQSRRPADETWSLPPPDGLDQSLINKITVCRYQHGGGFVGSTDCSVCLGEFWDGESLRVLPKCSHAFHLRCIDTWLKSHSNCPLCRCNIAPAAIAAAAASPEQEPTSHDQVVVVIGDLEPVCEHPASDDGEEEHKDQEAFDGRMTMSIAEVLQVSMEEELQAARASARRATAGAGPSRPETRRPPQFSTKN